MVKSGPNHHATTPILSLRKIFIGPEVLWIVSFSIRTFHIEFFHHWTQSNATLWAITSLFRATNLVVSFFWYAVSIGPVFIFLHGGCFTLLSIRQNVVIDTFNFKPLLTWLPWNKPVESRLWISRPILPVSDLLLPVFLHLTFTTGDGKKLATAVFNLPTCS